MRVLVCGGRDYKDRNKVFKTLYDLCDEFNLWSPEDKYNNKIPGPITIIHGGYPGGADRWADEWAVINWTSLVVFNADWDRRGKVAGPIRNQRMIDEGKPNLVIAFPGNRGTADMVRRAKKARVPVREIGA